MGSIGIATCGLACAGYSFVTGAFPMSYILSALLFSTGFSLYRHFDCIGKRAKLAKTILSNHSKKKKLILEKIEGYSKKGRKFHLVGATSLVSLLFLIGPPLLAIILSPLGGIWLRHLYKSYKTVYYTPIKWLKENF